MKMTSKKKGIILKSIKKTIFILGIALVLIASGVVSALAEENMTVGDVLKLSSGKFPTTEAASIIPQNCWKNNKGSIMYAAPGFLYVCENNQMDSPTCRIRLSTNLNEIGEGYIGSGGVVDFTFNVDNGTLESIVVKYTSNKMEGTYTSQSNTGTILSQGNVIIIAVVSVIAVVGAVLLVLRRKKTA